MNGIIVFVAKYFVLIPIIATIYLVWKQKSAKRLEMIILIIAVGIFSYALAKIGSHLYNDPRPYISDGSTPLFSHGGDPNGFPSDHTLLASALGFSILFYNRRVGSILLVVAALIGWARVAAHVHHTIDIIGSFIITGLSYLIIIYLLRNNRVRNILKLK